MREYDWDFRRLMEIDSDECKAAMGEHVLSMIDAGKSGREDAAGSIFDAVGRARLAQEGK